MPDCLRVMPDFEVTNLTAVVKIMGDDNPCQNTRRRIQQMSLIHKCKEYVSVTARIQDPLHTHARARGQLSQN